MLCVPLRSGYFKDKFETNYSELSGEEARRNALTNQSSSKKQPIDVKEMTILQSESQLF